MFSLFPSSLLLFKVLSRLMGGISSSFCFPFVVWSLRRIPPMSGDSSSGALYLRWRLRCRVSSRWGYSLAVSYPSLSSGGSDGNDGNGCGAGDGDKLVTTY